MLESLWVKNPWGKIGVDGMLAFVPPSQVWMLLVVLMDKIDWMDLI